MKQMKNMIIVILAVISGLVSIAYAAEKSMNPEEAKAFYKEAYEHTILNSQATKADYARYYAKDFTMYMDGKLYHFDDFVQLSLERQKARTSIQIIFKDMLAESDGVATVHATHIVKNDGSKLDLDVISFFRLRGHQFASGNELSRSQA